MQYDATKVLEFLTTRVATDGTVPITLAEMQMLESLVETVRNTGHASGGI